MRRGPAILALVSLAVGAFIAQTARAQFVPRPSEQMEEPESPGVHPPESPIELPPVSPSPSGLVPGELRVWIRSIEIRGATAFSGAELSEITSRFVDRELGTVDLTALTQAITDRYVAAGYVTSGAVLPDQDLESGHLIVAVVEGRVDEILIEGNRSFRKSYFRARLARAANAPFNIRRLGDQLVVFQRNPWIERVNAVLEPTGRSGIARLRVTVAEATPFRFQLHASNDSPPTIGTWGGGPALTLSNVLGHDDELYASARFTEGLRQVEMRERVPLNRWDTELVASYRYTESKVVDSPFDFLDISSEAHQAELELRHPLLRTGPHEVWASVVGSWARTRSRLLGHTACFQADLSDCEPTASVVRLRQEYLFRDRSTVVSARSTLNFGFASHLLDSTAERSSNGADSEFVSWLAQVWLLQRLATDRLGVEWIPSTLLVARGDLQLSNDPLLPTEQIAVGGPDSVRGYRRNVLVRDNAMIGSVELRVPVWTRAFGEPIIDMGPFFDVGRATDVSGQRAIRTLSSVGLALRGDIGMGVRVEASYGYRIRTSVDEGDGLQRDGVYLLVTWDVF